MCKTTTPPRPAAQDKLRKLKPNSAAGAVKPLQRYLEKYIEKYTDDLVPDPPPALPTDINQTAYKRVAFSIRPLLANAEGPYYAGVNDTDTDFAASLLKVAVLFTAGMLFSKAKAALSGAANLPSFLSSFNAAVKAEVNAHADPRILAMPFKATSNVRLLPDTTGVLTVSGFGTPAGPTVAFESHFKANLTVMITVSSDSGATYCIDHLGYGFMSAVLSENGFFDQGASNGIWLAGDYAGSLPEKRIPCINDHDDMELSTTFQMSRLFSMIRLKQLPPDDPDTNAFMAGLLSQAGSWLVMGQSIYGIKKVEVQPLFSIVHAKVGFAPLGSGSEPNVYSEGLIVKWTDSGDIDTFNETIDPHDENEETQLSGEFAISWQNLMARALTSGVDGIIEVLNNTISDFLNQEDL